MQKQGKLLKTAGFMVFATLLAKVFGMLRDMLLAANYGTTMQAVAYETASRVPLLLFDFVIGGVVTASFIPIFNEILERKNKDEAMRFANDYVNFILMVTIVITLAGIVFSPWLIQFLAPEIAPETKALAVNLSNIMFPMIIFTGLAFSFVGILQSFGEFNIPSIISLVSNSVMILYFFTFNNKFGIYGLAVTMLIGWGLQAVVQIPKLLQFGYRYRPSFPFTSPYIKRALRMALPILVSTWMQPVCTLINTRFASGIEGGRAISALRYANNLYIIVVGIFSFVATNLLFPYLSRAFAAGRRDEAKKLTVTSLKSLALIILPIMAGFMLLSVPLVSLIYERKAFTPSDVSMTATALMFYAVGMIGMAFNEILNKLFFSLQDAKTPMVTSVISMAANVLLAVVLSGTMGIGGIALASGLAAIINAILNYIFMVKKNGRLLSGGDALDLIKMLLATGIMAAAVWFLYGACAGMSRLWQVALPTLGGAAVYGAACLLLRITEVKTLTGMVLGRLKKDGKEN